ncbi:MAG: DUF2442 domain-containing protein [Deltaproteobacteria bacterium]|jgi:hypothetical protein
MNILPKTHIVLITEVAFEDEVLQVFLYDGREIRVPLEWFPKLRDASSEKRTYWRLIGKGIGIHWPDLDEDLSLAGLLR